jgi:hypothetical protein
MNDVYANFLAAYAGQTAKGNVIVAFEPLGLMPGLDPAAPAALAAATEFLSTNADALPDLTSGSYIATGRTVSGTYDILLNGAQPNDSIDVDAFNTLKTNALESSDNGAIGSLEGPFKFFPAYAAPANWYDPAAISNWTSYAFKTAPATAPAAPSPPPPARPPIQRFNPQPWRLMVAAPAVTQAAPAPAPVTANARFSNTRFVAQKQMMVAFHPVAVQPIVVDNSSPAPVLQPSLAITFDYCIVQLHRPWLSGDFLAAAGWYLNGSHAGDYANGPTPPVSPSGTPTVGGESNAPASAPFSFLPVACIAIKNLVISTTGSEMDPSVTASAAAFGPFALRTTSGSTNSLTNAGIQIVAWICAAQPELPPATDPALIPPTPEETAVGVVSTAVGILGSLLKHNS